MEAITLRAVLLEFLRRRVGDDETSQRAYARKVGIQRTDLNAALKQSAPKGKKPKQVSIGMLEKIAAKEYRTLSAALQDLTYVARDLESRALPPRLGKGRMSAEFAAEADRLSEAEAGSQSKHDDDEKPRASR